MDPKYEVDERCGGIRDIELNVIFQADPNHHICEIRLRLAAFEQLLSPISVLANRIAQKLHLVDSSTQSRVGEWTETLQHDIVDGVVVRVSLDFTSNVPFDQMCETLNDPNCRLQGLSLVGCFREEKSSVLMQQLLSREQKSLQEVQLSLNRLLTDPCLVALSNCSSLRSIQLRECALVTDIGVGALVEKCTKLQRVDLCRCTNIGDEPIIALAKNCPKLQTLVVAKSKVTGKAIMAIAGSCRHLRWLDVNKTNMTDEAVIALSQNCISLQYLNLGGNTQISDASVTKLAERCPRLEVLYVDGTQITDTTALKIVEGCTKLHTLGLGGTKITDKTIATIADKCTRLHTLDLCDTEVSDSGVMQIINKLGGQLKALKLGGTEITNTCVPKIAAKCKEIECLDLGNSPITGN
jgi:hypothetical protein